MKRLSLTLTACIMSVLALRGAVYTVSNNNTLPGSAGQYTTVDAAITAASNGDTILIQPSPTNYAVFTVNKSLTFIGSGYNPQTTNGLKTTFSGGNITFGNGSSNSKFIGIYMASNSIVWNNTLAVSNYTFIRCQPGSNGGIYLYRGSALLDPSNVIIENCVLSSLTLGSAPCIIKNNIFIPSGISVPITQSGTGTTHQIKNNLFLCTQATNTLNFLVNCVIENNIFFTSFPNTNCTTNTFNNNFVYGTSTLPFGSNVGSGNITNQIAIYPTWLACGTFAYTGDFRPLITSVCHNGGTDGTDIGPTGGTSPIYIYPAPYPLTGEAAIPQVTNVTVPVSSVPAGGTLNINVKARKRD